MHFDFSTFEDFKTWQAHPGFASWQTFVQEHPEGNFFQDASGFELFDATQDYRPVLIVGTTADRRVQASLLGVVQTNGTGLKSWFSRRLIVWGGPLVAPGVEGQEEARLGLLEELVRFAAGKSIYIEVRNFFDTTVHRSAFEQSGFEFRPHLNHLVRTDDLAAVRKRMSSSRWRQVKSSRKRGAELTEPESKQDLLDFYAILEQLYREKVKKPLPDLDVFRALWQSDHGKIFLVKYEGEVIGGIACPIFADRVIYEWYVCGKDGEIKGVHPSVLATWAPIEYALEHGLHHFDFMGAGKPDQDYGVREFKARFGGEEVAFGRYHRVVSKPLFEIGKLGLEVYQKIS